MPEIYAAYIIAGKKTFAQIPPSLQPKVKAVLAAKGLDEHGNPV